MVRRGSTSSEDVTIGFFGSGEGDIAKIQQALEGQLEDVPEDAEIRFILPVFEDVSPEIEEMSKWAINNELPYEAVTDQATSKTKAHAQRAMIDGATKTHVVSDIPSQIVKLLEKAPGPSLFVFLNAEDPEECGEIVQAAVDAGVPAYDLLDDMARLEPPPGDEDETPEPEASDDGEDYPVTRDELEAMERDELREIAKELGVIPPRSKEAMIDAILEAQGDEPEDEPEAEKEAPEPEPEPEAEADEETEDVVTVVKGLLDDFKAGMDDFSARLLDSLSGNGKAPVEPPAAPKRSRGRSTKATAKATAETAPASRRSPGRPRKDGTPARRRVEDPSTGRRVRTR